jgi:hypothetical protein
MVVGAAVTSRTRISLTLLCLVGLALGGGVGRLGAAATENDAPRQTNFDHIEREHGIRVDRVQLASSGYMIDFRYWVTDADKAWALFRGSSRRELVHQATGAKMIVPAPAYVGPMSQTSEKPKNDRRYYVFFGNPGKYVKSGDSVTIYIGDVEIGPLEVR